MLVVHSLLKVSPAQTGVPSGSNVPRSDSPTWNKNKSPNFLLVEWRILIYLSKGRNLNLGTSFGKESILVIPLDKNLHFKVWCLSLFKLKQIYASLKTTFMNVMGETAIKNHIGTTWLHWIWTVDSIKYFINAKFPDLDHCATVT